MFSPSGDHKTLTRMCVKCSIVLCCPPECRPLFTPSFFLKSSSVRLELVYDSPHPSISPIPSTEANGEGVWTQVCRIYRPIEQSGLSRDYLRTCLCTCWAESELTQWRSSSLSPVTDRIIAAVLIRRLLALLQTLTLFHLYVWTLKTYSIKAGPSIKYRKNKCQSTTGY